MISDVAAYGEAWASVYDAVNPPLPDDAEAVTLLADLVGSGRALEVGVGTGRLALPLAEAGVAASGMDASLSMLRVLKSKPAGPQVPVWVADMRRSSTQRAFDLVYLVGSTIFGPLSAEEQTATLAAAGRAAQVGGRVLVEAFVPDPARIVESVDTTHDARGQVIRSVRRVHVDGVEHALPVEVRYLSPEQLDALAVAAGLRPVARWADWRRSGFTRDSGSVIALYDA